MSDPLYMPTTFGYDSSCMPTTSHTNFLILCLLNHVVDCQINGFALKANVGSYRQCNYVYLFLPSLLGRSFISATSFRSSIHLFCRLSSNSYLPFFFSSFSLICRRLFLRTSVEHRVCRLLSLSLQLPYYFTEQPPVQSSSCLSSYRLSSTKLSAYKSSCLHSSHHRNRLSSVVPILRIPR